MIRIVRAVRTCYACPSQWDARTDTTMFVRLRYRHGIGTATTGTGVRLVEFAHGDSMAGSIELDEFCRRAGFELAEGAEA